MSLSSRVYPTPAFDRPLKTAAITGLWAICLVLLCGTPATQAQTLKADYQFQSTRSSSVGSSTLTDTGSNAFQTDTVDGASRTVLRFPFNNGLRLSPTTGIIPSNSYTIVMLFKVDSVSGFVRLVDFKNRTSDNGLYIASGNLENCTTCSGLAANTYVQVVYTRTSGGTFTGYLNGVQQGQGPDAGNDLVIDGNNILNFFQDDLAAGNEASAGSVARIRLYDAPMTGAQVAALERLTTITVTNTNGSGAGSLRQAILDSNNFSGQQTIAFNIPGGGVHTINPASALPTIIDPVIIDGATQPGFSGSPLIELNGGSAGPGTNGFIITTGNSTLRGLVINRFSGTGILVTGSGATGSLIQGNYIGTDAAGNTSLPNAIGIIIDQGATGNIIGTNADGTNDDAERNIVSGNTGSGVGLQGSGTNNNRVAGNYIGTNAAGMSAVKNGFGGLNIQAPASNNIIGGTSPAARNVISGNDIAGIAIQSSGTVTVPATGNVVQGNYIGVSADGVTPLGNTAGSQLGWGIAILRIVNGNTIGGTAAGAANVIAYNAGPGISVFGSTAVGNRILSNMIFSNGMLGIDLGQDGVTANDAGDGDTGPNSLQNFPILTSAISNGGNTTVQGTLNSAASTQFTIEFFSNPACDASGNGEGRTFLGSTTINTGGTGNATINATLPAVTVGEVVTATATDPSNNTSEFSACRVVTSPSFSISGRVLNDSSGALAGVAVTLSGAASANTTTDANGNYTFANLPTGGNYTVTPSSGNFSFSPASQTFNNLNVNRIANFVGTQTVFGITGRVTDSNNIPINNVTLALTRNGVAAGTAQTDVLGNYSFSNLTAGANYVVTPAGSFTPSSQSFSNLTSNATANFKAAPSIPSQCNTASFGAATNFAAGSGPIAVAVGDFNGDGKLDLAVANNSSANVSVLLGAGSGNFGAPMNLSVGSQPLAVAAADFNGDGKLDLAVANNNVVMLGDGTGGFGAPIPFTSGAGSNSIAVGDFNVDGKLDIAVSNGQGNNVSVSLGNGTGGFGAATNFAVGINPVSISGGDFNGDGKLDLVTTNNGSGNLSVLLGNGAGGFAAASNLTVVTTPSFVAVADFNGDGKLDFAVSDSGTNTVTVFPGTGAGGIGLGTSFVVGTAPLSVTVGDFNGDGKLDLVTANNNGSDLSVLLGDGAGSFAAAVNFPITGNPKYVAVADFNGDSKVDLAVANFSSNNASVLLNNATTCNNQSSVTISGQAKDANNNPLPEVTVTLSGPITRVVQTDLNGNYAFANLAPGGNYAVTLQSPYFVFAPSRADFFNLGSSQTANFSAAAVAVPVPTPPLSDDFTSPVRDANKWNLGTQTQPVGAVDPQVTTAQINGQLLITPLNQASGLHYNGYVSANSFDLTNGKASVELVRAAPGGADTIFAIGRDSSNFFRFMVHTAGGPTAPVMMYRGFDGVERPLDPTVPQLLLQVMVGGQLTTLPIVYDPVAHRYMRFRHEGPLAAPPLGAIVFEASPNNVDFTVLHRVQLANRTVDPMTLELSAGTAAPSGTGSAIFDNVGLVLSTFQFSAGSYTVGEGDGSALITVTRTGSTTDAASVGYATADGTASQTNKYITAVGTLSFAAGQTSRTFSVLIVNNVLTEGNQALNLLLGNPVNSGLNNPGRALLTITDNDTTVATSNPLDDAAFFVNQQYFDFLNRTPDPSGRAFWIDQITSCGTNTACVEIRRINVSAAFFISIEFQETGYLVYRIYKAAYGDLNPPAVPVPVRYSEFLPDTQQIGLGVVVGVGDWQTQLENNKVAFGLGFVTRSRFTTAYATTVTPAAFVDALFANAAVAPAPGDRTAAINEFGLATNTADTAARGRALRRVAENSTLNQQEFNRAFVLMQYFGYLRRNPNDAPDTNFDGYNFWLNKLNQFNGNFVNAEMVKAFIVSGEYRRRFGP